MSYNNKEDVTILPNIGSFVTVEHYKRHGSLSNNGSHQILVSAFKQLWLLKLGKHSQPYNLRAQHFYDKALQLQHQSDRISKFCRVDTADNARTLTFINAIASFHAEQHTEAATSNPPSTAATTVTPQAPLAINVSSPPRFRGHSCDFGSSVHDGLIYAEAVSPSGQERLCSSVQLFRGFRVRRTPRLQNLGLFRCASVGGSQRAH